MARDGGVQSLNTNRLTGVLFVVIGLSLFIAAGITGMSKRAFISSATTVEGTVSRLNAGGSHPQIEFISAGGQKISYPEGGFIFGYKAGDRVRVLYRLDDPANTAQIDSVGALWFIPGVFCLIGLFCLAGAMLTILRTGT
jgi:hypothetical protein